MVVVLGLSQAKLFGSSEKYSNRACHKEFLQTFCKTLHQVFNNRTTCLLVVNFLHNNQVNSRTK